MREGMRVLLGLALLPALGNLIGGVLAEWLRPSQRIVNLALHAATAISFLVGFALFLLISGAFG